MACSIRVRLCSSILQDFCFHCPFCSILCCASCSPRCRFTEQWQRCFTLPCFYCWTICEWIWVLQSVWRNPWDWLHIEVSACWDLTLVTPVLKLGKFCVIPNYWFFKCSVFRLCLYIEAHEIGGANSGTAGLCSLVVQIPDLFSIPPSPSSKKTGF